MLSEHKVLRDIHSAREKRVRESLRLKQVLDPFLSFASLRKLIGKLVAKKLIDEAEFSELEIRLFKGFLGVIVREAVGLRIAEAVFGHKEYRPDLRRQLGTGAMAAGLALVEERAQYAMLQVLVTLASETPVGRPCLPEGSPPWPGVASGDDVHVLTAPAEAGTGISATPTPDPVLAEPVVPPRPEVRRTKSRSAAAPPSPAPSEDGRSVSLKDRCLTSGALGFTGQPGPSWSIGKNRSLSFA